MAEMNLCSIFLVAELGHLSTNLLVVFLLLISVVVRGVAKLNGDMIKHRLHFFGLLKVVLPSPFFPKCGIDSLSRSKGVANLKGLYLTFFPL
jgi:hypothetical protein